MSDRWIAGTAGAVMVSALLLGPPGRPDAVASVAAGLAAIGILAIGRRDQRRWMTLVGALLVLLGLTLASSMDVPWAFAAAAGAVVAMERSSASGESGAVGALAALVAVGVVALVVPSVALTSSADAGFPVFALASAASVAAVAAAMHVLRTTPDREVDT